ncbi:MAG: CPBP family intramembrane metalloprotease [Cyclobacteriaceae bacterium]|nr:CPBP family intramembrane metalloprotease [Cyclobacteriaceae bacterium]
MKKTAYIFQDDPPVPWYSLFFLILIFGAGLFIGQFLGLLFSFFNTDLRIDELVSLISPPLTSEKRLPLLLIQGFGTLGGFIAGGIIYLQWIERYPPVNLFSARNLSFYTLLITLVMVISFMFVNTFFIDWNADVSFPDFMREFESWAMEKEEELKRVTEFLTDFSSFGQFLLGFLVIAILPAIGEELIFRGILQNKLHVYLKNIHLAVWISAILFSGFHIQFYGFVPRLMLGGLFGYMYAWSRNLWYPIIGHFINNGFTLIMLYLYQTGSINVNIEEEEVYPLSVIAIFAIIFAYMMISFRRKVKEEPVENYG